MHYNKQVIHKVVSIYTMHYIKILLSLAWRKIKRMTTTNRIDDLLDKI